MAYLKKTSSFGGQRGNVAYYVHHCKSPSISNLAQTICIKPSWKVKPINVFSTSQVKEIRGCK